MKWYQYTFIKSFLRCWYSRPKKDRNTEKDGKKDKIKQNKRLIVNEMKSTAEAQRPLPRAMSFIF